MSTTINLGSSVTFPSVMSATTMLTVTPGYPSVDQYGCYDSIIHMNWEMLFAASSNIIIKEMTQLKRNHPNVDIKKIQQMLNSGDGEMRELGLTTLQEYTKYTHQIIRYTTTNNAYGLETVITNYSKNNKTNITEDVL